MSFFSPRMRRTVDSLDVFEESKRGRRVSIVELESGSDTEEEPDPDGSSRTPRANPRAAVSFTPRQAIVIVDAKQALVQRLLKLLMKTSPEFLQAKSEPASAYPVGELKEGSREVLYTQLVQDVSNHWRTAPSASATSASASSAAVDEALASGLWAGFRARVHEIASHSRSSRGLSAEVDCVMQLRRALQRSDRRIEKLSHDRAARLGDYFEHYRTRAFGGTTLDRSSEGWRCRRAQAAVGRQWPAPQGASLRSRPGATAAVYDLSMEGRAGSRDGSCFPPISEPFAPTDPIGATISTFSPSRGFSVSWPPVAKPPSPASTLPPPQSLAAKIRSKQKAPEVTLVKVVRRRPFTTDLEEIEIDAGASKAAVAVAAMSGTWATSWSAGPPSTRRRPPPEPRAGGQDFAAGGGGLGATVPLGAFPGGSLTSMASQMSPRRSLPPLDSLSPRSMAEEASMRLPALDSILMSSTSCWDVPYDSPAGDELPLLPPDGGVALEGPDLAGQRYLEACHLAGVVPLTIPFVTGHSAKFQAQGRDLEDRDLMPIIAMAEHLEELEEIDLQGSARLTAHSLAPFFKAITEGNSVASTMIRLSLHGCVHAGTGTIAVLLTLLSAAARNQPCLWDLQELDLTGLRIAPKQYSGLAVAIGRHGSLRSVVLADTGLGNGGALLVVADLLRCELLESLDLSWSSFDTEVFKHLGQRIANAKKLKSLSLAGCSGAPGTRREIPIEYFLERLGHAPALTRLDISLNYIDWRGALILEDALEARSGFKDLNINDNSLGLLGMRSVLRLLAKGSSGLVKLQMESCAKESYIPGEEPSSQSFSATCPRGRYTLDLARPYHRALFRMLLKSCERFGVSHKKALEDVEYIPDTTPTSEFPSMTPRLSSGIQSTTASNIPGKRDSQGFWVVPRHGRLSFTFQTLLPGKGSAKMSARGASIWNFSDFLRAHNDRVRLQPSLDKVIPLLTHWRALAGHTAEQIAMLDALGMDFHVNFAQLRELARCRELTNEVVCRLLHCVTGGMSCRFLSLLLSPSHGDRARNYARLRTFHCFTADNPSGHYRFNLEVASDTFVAEQLLLLDRWEVEVDTHFGRPDTSQHGRRTHVRNLVHAERPVRGFGTGAGLLSGSMPPIGEWRLPTHDAMEFDYTSGKRPPEDAVPLDDQAFGRLMRTLHVTDVDIESQADVLRWVAQFLYLTSLQLRALLGHFQSPALRSDVAVIFFFRVTDIHNEKLFRVRFEDPLEQERLHHRLGVSASLPYVQPERAHLLFDLQFHDHRLAVSLLVQLAYKEKPSNLRCKGFFDALMKTDPIGPSVPRTWEAPEKIPTSGILRLSYCCLPDDRSFSMRRSFLERFGLWKTSVTEKAVMWWTGLSEVPQDAQTLMEWVASRHENVFEPFKSLAQRKGRNGINLAGVEAPLRELGFNLFAEDEFQRRAQAAFRFLDIHGEGCVSEAEWQVVDQVRQELVLSIREIIAFLQRAFPSTGAGFLEEVWATIDKAPKKPNKHDKKGDLKAEKKVEPDEITIVEWNALMVETLKYAGSTDVVFRFLDRAHRGRVCEGEFRLLSNYFTA